MWWPRASVCHLVDLVPTTKPCVGFSRNPLSELFTKSCRASEFRENRFSESHPLRRGVHKIFRYLSSDFYNNRQRTWTNKMSFLKFGALKTTLYLEAAKNSLPCRAVPCRAVHTIRYSTPAHSPVANKFGIYVSTVTPYISKLLANVCTTPDTKQLAVLLQH